ncbi:hypothetical protein HNQ71_005919 [Mesorhizobium sangaii]|uniref:Uncharacterized protein n=1 Tax=Mesorhizobium sangaii TaxID=505389 RepID=A0A841PHX3_9HYPH|nr:hypothetical protein [Mesorhizobium sangaii]
MVDDGVVKRDGKRQIASHSVYRPDPGGGRFETDPLKQRQARKRPKQSDDHEGGPEIIKSNHDCSEPTRTAC